MANRDMFSSRFGFNFFWVCVCYQSMPMHGKRNGRAVHTYAYPFFSFAVAVREGTSPIRRWYGLSIVKSVSRPKRLGIEQENGEKNRVTKEETGYGLMICVGANKGLNVFSLADSRAYQAHRGEGW